MIGVFLDTGEKGTRISSAHSSTRCSARSRTSSAVPARTCAVRKRAPGNGFGTHGYLKRCRHHNVDGAVLMGLDAEDPEVRRLVRSDVPTVGVDVELEGPATSYVCSDNEGGATLGVGHLHGWGTGGSRRSPACSTGRRAPTACAATATGCRHAD